MMRYPLLILVIAVALLGVDSTAQQQPDSQSTVLPPPRAPEPAAEPKKESRPFPRDPLKEAMRLAQKAADEKAYAELKESSAELAALSKEMSDEIHSGGQYVISARVFDKLDQIDKLSRKIRDRAQGR